MTAWSFETSGLPAASKPAFDLFESHFEMLDQAMRAEEAIEMAADAALTYMAAVRISGIPAEDMPEALMHRAVSLAFYCHTDIWLERSGRLSDLFDFRAEAKEKTGIDLPDTLPADIRETGALGGLSRDQKLIEAAKMLVYAEEFVSFDNRDDCRDVLQRYRPLIYEMTEQDIPKTLLEDLREAFKAVEKAAYRPTGFSGKDLNFQ